MRPKRLSIEGLNSFIERQTIDFDRLTSKGFFGIFGPTGSGKSSILDGITLALYGRIARGSAEFVNKQVDTLSLSYEFSLGHQVFRVEREIKRNKSGEIRTAYAKLTELTSEGEEVLEDKASSVSKRCEEIIGLSVEDFSRTVVLPQGKFSEFLRLPNGQRREMLERIFNLEAYGAELSGKVARHVARTKAELSVINGQMMGYEDLNEESLRILESEIHEKSVALESHKAKLKEVEVTYTEAKLILERFEHFKQTEALLNSHIAKKSDYELALKQLENHDKASLLKPHWEQYDKTVSEKIKLGQSLAEVKTDFEKANSSVKEAESVLNALTERLEKDIPNLKSRLDLLREGRKDIELLMKDKAELDIEKQKLQDLEKIAFQAMEDFNNSNEAYETLDANLKEIDLSLEAIQVPDSYKSMVRKALSSLELHSRIRADYQSQIEVKEKLENQVNAYDQEIQKLELSIEKLKTLRNASETRLNRLKEEEKNQQTLLGQRELSKEKLRDLLVQYDETKVQLTQLPEQDIAAESETEQMSIESLLGENTSEAHWISHFKLQYQTEAKCPICGQQSQMILRKKLMESLERIESQWQSIWSQSSLSNPLGNGVTPESLRVFEGQSLLQRQALGKLVTELETASIQLSEQVEDISDQLQRLSRTQAESTMTQNQLEEAVKKLDQLKLEEIEAAELGEAVKLQLEPAHSRLDLHGLRLLVQSIEDSELKLEALKKEQKSLKQVFEVKKLEREKHLILRNQSDSELQIKRGTLEKSLEHYQNQKDKLTLKLGPLMQVKSECERIEAELEAFDLSYQNEKANLQRKLDAYSKLQNTYIELLGREKDLEKSSFEQLEILSQKIISQGFMHLEEAKGALLVEEQYNLLKENSRSYQKRLDELLGTLASLQEKLEGLTLDQEAFSALELEYEGLKQQISDTEQSLAQLQLKQMQTKERLVAFAELIEKKEAVLVRQGQLLELSKLFEARKFVAFIASTQMAYISGKASEQLLEMTQGSYGIEAQADGSFLIRDYKNGGVTRDVSTLSGGETFLVSLALALALSAQVQLKGKAPLELFFLDEGFGTLDDETLEVVLSALESLSHERLSIGLISHVEAIKNRVPIKLLVTPAKSGMGGSKVKIELS